jgi:hypothetical protein
MWFQPELWHAPRATTSIPDNVQRADYNAVSAEAKPLNEYFENRFRVPFAMKLRTAPE